MKLILTIVVGLGPSTSAISRKSCQDTILSGSKTKQVVDQRINVTAKEDRVFLSILKRNEISQIGWLTGGENFVSKGDQFKLYAFVDF